MPLAVGSEEAVDQQPRAAILKLVAFLAEAGNALIRWADAVNFTANVLSVLPREGFCGLLRISAARDEDRDLPLILSFAGARPGNLVAVDHPPFRACFPSPASLFVACARWQQENCVAGFHQHIGTDENILMDPQGDFCDRLANLFGLRQRVDKVSTALPYRIQFTSPSSQNHRCGSKALPGRGFKAPVIGLGKAARIIFRHS